MGERSLKREVLRILKSENLEKTLSELGKHSGREVLHGLFSGLCSSNETVKWHAVTAMGIAVAKIADRDMEEARIVMRRLMWSLNDESGGIGWGAPEAMAEIICCHERLAGEYIHLPVSYMREDGNFLELPPLQRGVVWGIGRLAQARKKQLLEKNPVRYLIPYLNSKDAVVRGTAAWAAGLLDAGEAGPSLSALVRDLEPVSIFREQRLAASTVGKLAEEALLLLSSRTRQ